MRCPECGGNLRVTGATHRYDESGLPNVILHGVEVRACRKCGEEEVAIPNIEGLHRCIAHALAARPSALTAREVRFLRRFLGHSSRDFARLLGVTPETVSRWENEQRDIPAAADRVLRLLVFLSEPRRSYEREFLASIRPTPPRRPRLEVRLDGNRWETAKAA